MAKINKQNKEQQQQNFSKQIVACQIPAFTVSLLSAQCILLFNSFCLNHTKNVQMSKHFSNYHKKELMTLQKFGFFLIVSSVHLQVKLEEGGTKIKNKKRVNP